MIIPPTLGVYLLSLSLSLLFSRYLLARRNLVAVRNREEMDEVSNKRLTSMAADVASGLAFLHEQK